MGGLEEGTKKSPPAIASLIRKARWLTLISWLTYPCVYLIKTGVPGPTPTTLEQIGYSIADVVAKAVFGIMIWAIASAKSAVDETALLTGRQVMLGGTSEIFCGYEHVASVRCSRVAT